ncbi:MAG: DegT/DnrJ/EryC1/StrS family aminotransferase [Candidatus Thermoplasmatota archaeon]
MDFKIPLFKTYWDQEDIDAISKVIRRGTYWATGPEIQEFEQKMADFVKREYCVSFNSGTSALHTVLLAYNITSGEVIVPSFTFISTANAVLLAGATPVFAETEYQTYGLDIESVKQKITNKTNAIIPLHYGGLPSRDINKLKELADENDLLLIEDAAESLGSKIDNQMTGSVGDAAMFSFCQNKVITTGEGGMIVTDSKDVYEKMKLIRSHGRVESTDTDYFSTTEEMDYIDIGYNFRMPTMNAALGVSQLKKINKIIDLRREKAFYYHEKLKDIDEIILPKELKNQRHVYQMYTIQLKNKKTRDNLQKHLTKKGVMTKVYFYPIHLKTYYKNKFGYKKGDLSKTEQLSEKVLTLPMYASMPKKEINYVTDSIKKFFKEG